MYVICLHFQGGRKVRLDEAAKLGRMLCLAKLKVNMQSAMSSVGPTNCGCRMTNFRVKQPLYVQFKVKSKGRLRTERKGLLLQLWPDITYSSVKTLLLWPRYIYLLWGHISLSYAPP